MSQPRPATDTPSSVAEHRALVERFSGRGWLPLLAGLALLAAFWRLGAPTVFEWDEAQPGQIAFEMVRTGNWLRYTYEAQPEQAYARPPLLPWAIAASYRLLGPSELALRLPAALAALLVVLATYALARLYTSRTVAALACLILISSRGVFGMHIGRTGDTDALLLAGQIWFVYLVLRYLAREGRPQLRREWLPVLASLCLALAFWSKGIAAFALPAGLLLHTVLTRRIGTILRSAGVWLGAAVFGTLVLVWYWLAPQLGPPQDGGKLPGPTLFSSSAFFDAFSRAVANVEDHGRSWNPTFPWQALESLWSPWLFVLVILLLIEELTHWRARPLRRVGSDDGVVPPAALVSGQIGLPLLLALVLMRSKLTWYAAPLVPLLSLLLAALLHEKLARSRPWLTFAALVLAGSLVWQAYRLHVPVVDPACALVATHQHEIATAPRVLLNAALPQRVRLALCFRGGKTEVAESAAELDDRNGALVIGTPEYVARFAPTQLIAQASGMELHRLQEDQR